MLQILSSYFMKDGFNVLTAGDGEQALEMFYEHQIDIAILDWMMPKLNGVEVCKKSKKSAEPRCCF
ncbi:Transcriptional regulatory protein WalR [compost metagenome]